MLKRRFASESTEDEGSIVIIQYNSEAGAQKNVAAGPALVYIGSLDVERAITPGDQLYILNTTGNTDYIKMSKTSGIAPFAASPASDTFPVFGHGFTIYSASDYKHIKGVSHLHLYKMKDAAEVRINP
jgi:hypothetical protein